MHSWHVHGAIGRISPSDSVIAAERRLRAAPFVASEQNAVIRTAKQFTAVLAASEVYEGVRLAHHLTSALAAPHRSTRIARRHFASRVLAVESTPACLTTRSFTKRADTLARRGVADQISTEIACDDAIHACCTRCAVALNAVRRVAIGTAHATSCTEVALVPFVYRRRCVGLPPTYT